MAQPRARNDEGGRFEEAITAYEQAIAIFGEVGDHYGHARTMENLGIVYADIGEPERARQAWADAAGLFTSMGVEDDAASRVRKRVAALTRKRGRWWRRNLVIERVIARFCRGFNRTERCPSMW